MAAGPLTTTASVQICFFFWGVGGAKDGGALRPVHTVAEK